MDWVSPGVDGYQALLVGHTVDLLESWFSLLTQLTLLSPQMPLPCWRLCSTKILLGLG